MSDQRSALVLGGGGITGIAWDHINVFPTFDNYLEQFRIFIDKIESKGHLIYNETDNVLKDLVEKHKRKDKMN